MRIRTFLNPRQKTSKTRVYCTMVSSGGLQSAPRITIAPVSADRGEIYGRKCPGCKTASERNEKAKHSLRVYSPSEVQN